MKNFWIGAEHRGPLYSTSSVMMRRREKKEQRQEEIKCLCGSLMDRGLCADIDCMVENAR